MLTLRNLGGLQLLAADGSPVLGQRLRLAVLAVIASGREMGVSRDRLLLLFWPESTLPNARGSLDQVLYQLRRQLGDEAFLAGTDPVRLNPEAVTDEAWQFERRHAAGELDLAIALYRGPYLDGFHLGGSAEFDQWLDAERSRLAARFAEAATAMADAAEARGDQAEAATRWQALVAHDPLSARAVAGLMRTSARAGDPALALRVFGGYEALLRGELGGEPDTAMRALADAIRRGALHGDAAPAPAAGVPGSPVAAPPARTRLTQWLLVATLLLAGMVMVRRWPRQEGPPPAPVFPQLAVFPFTVLGPHAAGSGWLTEAIPDLLAARLRLIPDLRVVDPTRAIRSWTAGQNDGPASPLVAERAMATLSTDLAIVGRVLADSASLEVGAELLDSRGRPLESASARGPRDSLAVLIDRLASRLMAGHAGDDRVRRAAFVGLPWPAVQAYLEGRAARRSGRLGQALVAFERAVDLDSTFALAALEFVAATGMLSNRSVALAGGGRATVAVPSGPGAARGITEARYQQMLARALRHAERLPPPDRAYLRALAGRAYPSETTIRQRLADWEAAVAMVPDRSEVRYQAGLVLLYQAPALGVADAWPRAIAEFRKAIELDPGLALPWLGLMEAAGLQGDWKAADEHAGQFLARAEQGELATFARWFREAAAERDRPRRAGAEALEGFSSNVLGSIALASQVHGIGLEDGDRADVLLTTRATTRAQRRVAYYDRAIFLLNQGRGADAAAAMEVKNGYDPYAHVGLFQVIRFGLYWDGDSAQTLAAAHTLTELINRTTAADTITWAQPAAFDRAAWFLAQWYLWRGELAAAHRARARLERREPGQPPADPAFFPSLAALEEVLGAGPAARSAAERLDSLALAECCGVFMNLVAARALARVGLTDRALAAAQRGRWARLPEHLSAYLAEEARLALALGDSTAARRALEHLQRLSQGAEPRRLQEIDRLRRAIRLR